MKKTYSRLFPCILAGALVCSGQAVGAEPSVLPTNINARSMSPKLLPDNRVEFAVKSPDANSIKLALGHDYDMVKDADGVWRVTTDPQVPGFHYYSLILDGVNVADPASMSYFGCGRMSSAVDIPEEGCEWQEVKDVPHGSIRTVRYYSNRLKCWRVMNVYTPPSYDKDSARRYPVLYVCHGGGEDHTGWGAQGRTDIILDNLIGEGKAQEMIVVMPNGNIPVDGKVRMGYNREAMAPFADELVGSIVPFVDANFRTQASREGRALAGLSMGGGQAFYAGLPNTDLFSHVGVFSSGVFGGAIFPGEVPKKFDPEKEMPGLVSEKDRYNRDLNLFYVSVGTDDARYSAVCEAVETMRNAGLDVEFSIFPGGHEWQVWRKSLHDIAPRLFRGHK